MYWIKLSCFKTSINSTIFLFIIITHLFGFYGFYLSITGRNKSITILYHFLCGYLAIIGALTGAHRLWSHRSYDANRIIKVLLICFETYAGHLSVYKWVRDHRVHHKYVDTDADPYNIKRGLFFSQIGWIAMKKTDEFKEKVKTLNYDDVLNDALVMFQDRHYFKLLLIEWLISSIVPCYFWKENYLSSACTLLLVYVVINIQVGTINSISHYYGWRPYDTNIEPTFSRLVAYLTLGEGYHNFHHTFPEDYSQSEMKWTKNFNISALLIDFWEYMGWVSKKKVAHPFIIAKRRQRTGDITVKIYPFNVILDQVIGVIVFTWALWLTFLVRNIHLMYSDSQLISTPLYQM